MNKPQLGSANFAGRQEAVAFGFASVYVPACLHFLQCAVSFIRVIVEKRRAENLRAYLAVVPYLAAWKQNLGTKI